MTDDGPSRAPWRRGERYDYLRHVERRMLAWEWLRRTHRYGAAWDAAATEAERLHFARQFGLVELLPPSIGADVARPIWRASLDPQVIPAAALAGEVPEADRFDVRRLGELASVALNDEDIEHWRIGTAARSLRLDVHAGTLLGGPTPLRFELIGLVRVRPQLRPLHDLIELSLTSPPYLTPKRDERAERWIAELRTADALAVGASQQEIARELFGRVVSEKRWRLDGDSIRSRTRRLIRAARARLADPVADFWFR